MDLLAVTLVFAVALFLLLASMRALAVTRVPVVTAPPEVVQAALDLLALRDGEHFTEIGCGWGGVLRAARRRADVQAIGFEINPAVAAVAALRSLADGKVRVRCRDARRSHLGKPDAVYAFLMPHAMAELGPVFEAQLAAGARVLSVDFQIPDWTPVERRRAGSPGHEVLLYVIGRHRAAPDEPQSPTAAG